MAFSSPSRQNYKRTFQPHKWTAVRLRLRNVICWSLDKCGKHHCKQTHDWIKTKGALNAMFHFLVIISHIGLSLTLISSGIVIENCPKAFAWIVIQILFFWLFLSWSGCANKISWSSQKLFRDWITCNLKSIVVIMSYFASIIGNLMQADLGN